MLGSSSTQDCLPVNVSPVARDVHGPDDDHEVLGDHQEVSFLQKRTLFTREDQTKIEKGRRENGSTKNMTKFDDEKLASPL